MAYEVSFLVPCGRATVPDSGQPLCLRWAGMTKHYQAHAIQTCPWPVVRATNPQCHLLCIPGALELVECCDDLRDPSVRMQWLR